MGDGGTYSSGLFCVSITAAMGIPKFETGPQKSELRIVSFPILPFVSQQIRERRVDSRAPVSQGNIERNVRVEQK